MSALEDPFSTPITANGMTTIIATGSQGVNMIDRPESVTGLLTIGTSNVSVISIVIVQLLLVVIALPAAPSELFCTRA